MIWLHHNESKLFAELLGRTAFVQKCLLMTCFCALQQLRRARRNIFKVPFEAEISYIQPFSSFPPAGIFSLKTQRSNAALNGPDLLNEG